MGSERRRLAISVRKPPPRPLVSSWVHRHASDMGDRAKRGATYEDLLRVSEHRVAEILDGELVVSPRPGSQHTLASSSLGGALMGPFHFGGGGGPGGWVILDEPELHLGADVLVPDIAGWRRERMPELPDVAAFELAPDWICEVLSPSTGARDRADKLPIYARSGVTHAWLVDPQLRTLEVLRREGDKWVLLVTYRDEALCRAEPFDAIELALGVLWAR